MNNKISLETKRLGKELLYKEITDSTSLDIKRMAESGSEEGLVVCADMQTAGRGRRGRSWQSSKGENLLFSLLLRPGIAPDKAPQITLLMALAVTKILREDYGLEAKIKWPNDVVLNGKKVCGILTEMFLKGNSSDYVIVGTGINVNQTIIPEELFESATSLLLQEGCEFSREDILGKVLRTFEQYYDDFLIEESLENVVSRYNEWLVSLNLEVRVLDPQGEYSGLSRGITNSGELIVELPGGETTVVYAGEVSVRGLYGYV